MKAMLKKIAMGTVLAATAATALTATPAAAQSWHGGYARGGYGAGAAVAAGVVGLAVGAALADQEPYYGDPAPVGYAPYGGPGCYEAYPGYEGACYPVADYYRMGWSWHGGSWWNRDGHRFDRPFIGGAPRGGFAGGGFGHGGYAHGGYAGGGYAGGGYAHGGFGGGHGWGGRR